ncbi:hypothetical protein Tco_1555967 [Tanacetum coccineum]
MTNVIPAPPTDPPNTRDGSKGALFDKVKYNLLKLGYYEISFLWWSRAKRSSLNRFMDSDKYLEDLWHIILNGDFPPFARNKETQVLEVVPFEEQSDDHKQKLAKNNEAKMVMEKDFEIYRGKKEIVKSIALKAKKESSDDETLTSGSDDEEYVMAAFIGGSWSDSENDAEDKTNDKTCLMAQTSNEATFNSSYYSDNASYLDNDKSHHRCFPVDTRLIHLESYKSLTAELFDVDSGRISIVIVNTKEYHSDILAIITRIMRRSLDNSL